MGTLRILELPSPSERHTGEIYSCTFTPDGTFVLSAGWDGFLRLWDCTAGDSRLALPVSYKPLSSCACSPDGLQWYSGSMDGLLGIWDGVSHQPLNSFLAHTRPISAITFSPDGKQVATSSWDRNVVLRKVGNERDGRVLGSHLDIVAGCSFSVDGSQLLSWSFDGSIKIWDVARHRELATLQSHTDRVTALAISPDGRYALSGGRDSTIRLWDLDHFSEIGTVNLGAEVRACFYLLDAESVVVVDAVGRIFLMAMPTFQVQAQLQTSFRVMCGALSPSGSLIALGGEEGLLHFVAVEGYENSSFVVTAVQNLKQEATMLDRFLGKTRTTRTFSYTCPACRQTLESQTLPAQPVNCPRCRRFLRVNYRVPQFQNI